MKLDRAAPNIKPRLDRASNVKPKPKLDKPSDPILIDDVVWLRKKYPSFPIICVMETAEDAEAKPLLDRILLWCQKFTSAKGKGKGKKGKIPRQITAHMCMRGIWYFDPKDRACQACWGVHRSDAFPKAFINAEKIVYTPEANDIYNRKKKKGFSIDTEEGGEANEA